MSDIIALRLAGVDSDAEVDDGHRDDHDERAMTEDEKANIDAIAEEEAARMKEEMESNLIFKLSDRPPWYTMIILAFQHFLSMFTGVLAMPLMLAPFLCYQNDLDTLSKLISTTFIVSGIQTFIQVTVGIRLPIIQGPSVTFFLPVVSMATLRGECPVIGEAIGNYTTTRDDVQAEFRERMQIVQGGLIVASLFEMAFGFGGVISLLLRYIGPLTIAPTIGLIGISIIDIAVINAREHWGIAALTTFLIILFSEYISKVNIPCFGYAGENGCHVYKFPVFRLFPVILSILVSWIFCLILTVTNVFPDDPEASGYSARTDVALDQLRNTSWFYVPYPGQWGVPKFSAGIAFGMMAGAMASMIESLGDYYACARLSGAPPPPPHAMNRAIGIEGFGGLFSGLWGSGMSSTSYSNNIGVIGMTKVSSLYVVMVMSLITVLAGLVLKVGAFFATIPPPIMGGVFAVLFGLVASVGFSNLNYVDMNSPRNLLIVGLSFFVGLGVPPNILENPNAIDTGSEVLDQILFTLLTTSMFLGGFVAFILDNTIRGTATERGMVNFATVSFNDDGDSRSNLIGHGHNRARIRDRVSDILNRCYDLPVGMSYIRKWKWTTKIPFSPTFKGFNIKCRFKKDYDSHSY